MELPGQLSILNRFISTGHKSALSLYRADIATMESGESGAEWSGGEAEGWSDGVLESWIGLLHKSIAALKAMVKKQVSKKLQEVIFCRRWFRLEHDNEQQREQPGAATRHHCKRIPVAVEAGSA